MKSQLDWLEQPVTIHFKENSIPGLRRGVLTDESKRAILKKINEAYNNGWCEGYDAGLTHPDPLKKS